MISMPIDMWALGVVLTFMAGVPFTVCDHLSLAKRWKRYLGVPPLELGGPSPAMWLRPGGGVPSSLRLDWLAQSVTALGRVGIELLVRLLEYDPRQRMTAAELLEHEFLRSCFLPLVGIPSSGATLDGEGAPDSPGLDGSDLIPATMMINGVPPGWESILCGHAKRHAWSMRFQQIQRDILLWLQQDDMFIKGTPANKLVVSLVNGEEVIEYFPTGKKKPVRCHITKTLTGKKARIGGHLGHPGTTLITLKIGEACPLARVIDFMKAFVKVNMGWLLAMQSKAKAGVRRLGKHRRGANGTTFLRLSLEEWFLSSCELGIIDAGDEHGGFLEEDHHQDGPMSVFHGGLTISGARDLICDLSGSKFEPGRLSVFNEPGTMYLGNLSGPYHQVFHRRCDYDCVDIPGLGKKSVTVMMRTGLFCHGRSRGMHSTSNSPKFFASVANSFVDSMQVDGICFPTFDEVLVQHEARVGNGSIEAAAGYADATFHARPLPREHGDVLLGAGEVDYSAAAPPFKLRRLGEKTSAGSWHAR